jgi:hypothetical protein
LARNVSCTLRLWLFLFAGHFNVRLILLKISHR